MMPGGGGTDRTGGHEPDDKNGREWCSARMPTDARHCVVARAGMLAALAERARRGKPLK